MIDVFVIGGKVDVLDLDADHLVTLKLQVIAAYTLVSVVTRARG
jgi:hypothetical protein